MDKFFAKYEKGVENNRVRFRDISKIARGEVVGIPREKIVKAIKKYINQFNYTIEEAFQDSVGDAYSERTTERKLQDLLSILKETVTLEDSEELRDVLIELRGQINRLLK